MGLSQTHLTIHDVKENSHNATSSFVLNCNEDVRSFDLLFNSYPLVPRFFQISCVHSQNLQIASHRHSMLFHNRT